MVKKSFIASQFEEAFLKMQRAKEDEIKSLEQFWGAMMEDFRNENCKENTDSASQYDEAKDPIAGCPEMSKEEWRALRRAELKKHTNNSIDNGYSLTPASLRRGVVRLYKNGE